MGSRKLFIVAPDRPDLFTSLQRAIGHEPGVEILYDRRASVEASAAPQQGNRRERPEVSAQIGERGFAVITLAGGSGSRLLRWDA